ncbi:GNAT family N-acetyltransferase [Microbacterium telephonicum]|uniref:RimJ/RimL family protein N-acetyltransferase n=1 Tax=Microbacterium telephonicum TaxID=1714841 RepID=A0A498C9B4_9MICO|nr:GNAT family N-acetyltransferase [Microbacterium telephonicum]RLK52365.1 RimJ/RimL family protein N-acetyltransferase [Microbacterium telephonicum]
MDVTLRRWADEDFPLLEAFNTPEMTAHLGGPETAQQLVERQARYLRLNESGEARMFRVDVDGVPAGGIGYWQVDHDGREAFETGWSTLPQFQGLGVARAALRLVVAQVRSDGRRDLLVAYPGIDNPPSNALCRGAGFVATGEGSEPWRGGILHFRTWELDLSPLDLAGRMPVLDERFTGDALDETVWWPHYTPHWSSRAASAARYHVDDGLELRIDVDTAPWAPEWDGDVRVSHLQTGQHSGAVGSGEGQHRFRDGLVVREQQTERRLMLPHHGVIEVRMSAIRHPDAMVAFWPIGFEARPDDCGEICVAEIFGSEIEDDGGWVGVGVKPQRDPRLREDFEKIRIDGDLTAPHDYAVEWTPDLLRFFVDGQWVKSVGQRLDYPVQLMLDVYELPRPDGHRDLAALPHVLRVERVRVFAP